MWPLRKGVESGKHSHDLPMAFLPFGVESCMQQRRDNFARWVKVKLSGIFSEGYCVHRCTRNTGEVRPRQQRPRLSGDFRDTLASGLSIHKLLYITNYGMKFFSFYPDNTPEKVRGKLTVMGKS